MAKHSRRETASMSQQLKKAFPEHRRPFRNRHPSLPPIENWVGEGIDHIRIDRNSSDPLGKYLFPEHYSPFRHHIFDRFTSISGFWLYITLQDRDDIVRDMSGTELAKYRKRAAVRDVPQLRAIIADTYWRRLQDSPQMLKRLEESTLPFDIYFLSEGVGLRIRNRNAAWMVPMFEEIRKAVKEKREPDFDFLKSGRPADIYEDVIPKYGVNLNVEVQQRNPKRKRPEAKNMTKPVTEEDQVAKEDKPEATEAVAEVAQVEETAATAEDQTTEATQETSVVEISDAAPCSTEPV